MEYDIVVHTELSDLIKLVNKNMKNGWKTLGGVFALHGAGSIWSYQEMIKEE